MKQKTASKIKKSKKSKSKAKSGPRPWVIKDRCPHLKGVPLMKMAEHACTVLPEIGAAACEDDTCNAALETLFHGFHDNRKHTTHDCDICGMAVPCEDANPYWAIVGRAHFGLCLCLSCLARTPEGKIVWSRTARSTGKR